MPAQDWTVAEQDQFIAEAMEHDAPRLRSFISKRVFDTGDAEDILQDVFYELIQTYRLMKPVEKVTAWLYRVARNRITDLFRRQRPESLHEPAYNNGADEAGTPVLLDLLPSEDDGPDAIYARNLLLESLDDALEELPEEQREVFIAHELLGRSFKEMSDETGTSINTLLSRKRYAVLHLRRRLEEINQHFVNE
jgi:RNA polymerase sigma factor (sigma-70 family)